MDVCILPGFAFVLVTFGNKSCTLFCYDSLIKFRGRQPMFWYLRKRKKKKKLNMLYLNPNNTKHPPQN